MNVARGKNNRLLCEFLFGEGWGGEGRGRGWVEGGEIVWGEGQGRGLGVVEGGDMVGG